MKKQHATALPALLLVMGCGSTEADSTIRARQFNTTTPSCGNCNLDCTTKELELVEFGDLQEGDGSYSVMYGWELLSVSITKTDESVIMLEPTQAEIVHPRETDRVISLQQGCTVNQVSEIRLNLEPAQGGPLWNRICVKVDGDYAPGDSGCD